MTHQRTAEELREHAAVAVANVRTEIHTAFKRGAAKGFSRSHIRETLQQRGYKPNDIAYVEQLLDGTQPHPQDPRRKVTFQIPPVAYLAIAAVLILLIGFATFRTLNAGEWQEQQLAAQTKAYAASKISQAQQAVQQLQSAEQSLTILADQLTAFPSLSANLAPADRDALLIGHAEELRAATLQLEQQLTLINERLIEIAEANAQCE